MPEHIFVLFISCSKRHDLDRILAKFIHHIGDQVKALLICEPGHDSQHHDVMILLQVQFLLKRDLILYLLPPETVRCVVFLDVGIRGRVVIFIVNSVHNSGQAVRAGIHKPLQLLPVERRLYLFGIGVAHRGDPVRIHDAALQVIGILVRFQLVRRKIILRKSRNISYPLGIPCPLELQVMYSHDRLDPPVILIPIAEIIQIYRNQPCLPVMAVNDVRPEADHR